MGQYYTIVNLDRQEYLNPLRFGDGCKVREFGFSSYGVMSALAILLAKSSRLEGGGEFDSEITGAWAGDRIIIIGDYDESGLHQRLYKEYTDVSLEVLRVMVQDEFCCEVMLEGKRQLFMKEPLKLLETEEITNRLAGLQNDMDDRLLKWELWRLDDNGHEFCIRRFSSESEALRLMQVYEERGHKQTYFIRERSDEK